jgi:hypothetical protein
MTKIKWREVLKFLSGAALAGSLANAYLWLSGVSVPFLGYTITPRLLGARAVVQFALFVMFLYLGWLRKQPARPSTPVELDGDSIFADRKIRQEETPRSVRGPLGLLPARDLRIFHDAVDLGRVYAPPSPRESPVPRAAFA